MKSFLLGLLMALASLSALAGPRFTNGSDYIELGQGPCSEDVAKIAKEKGVEDEMFAAKASVDGKQYRACWLLNRGVVNLVYEDGDLGLVPANLFEDKSL